MVRPYELGRRIVSVWNGGLFSAGWISWRQGENLYVSGLAAAVLVVWFNAQADTRG